MVEVTGALPGRENAHFESTSTTKGCALVPSIQQGPPMQSEDGRLASPPTGGGAPSTRPEALGLPHSSDGQQWVSPIHRTRRHCRERRSTSERCRAHGGGMAEGRCGFCRGRIPSDPSALPPTVSIFAALPLR